MANSFFLHNCLSQSIKGRFRQRRTMGGGCCLSPAPSSLSERYFCLDVNKVAFWNMLLNQEGRRWAEPAWFLDRQPDTLCLGAAPVSGLQQKGASRGFPWSCRVLEPQGVWSPICQFQNFTVLNRPRIKLPAPSITSLPLYLVAQSCFWSWSEIITSAGFPFAWSCRARFNLNLYSGLYNGTYLGFNKLRL